MKLLHQKPGYIGITTYTQPKKYTYFKTHVNHFCANSYSILKLKWNESEI